MPKLYVMIGLSASGKSTIAKKISESENIKLVSSDDIRDELFGGFEDQSSNGEVFQVFYDRIVEELKNNKDVIADATNITIATRKKLFERIEGIECDVIGYLCIKDFDSCLIDDKKRENTVGKRVLKRQLGKFQIPFIEEGFKSIVAFNHVSDKYETIDFLKSMDSEPYKDTTLLQHTTNVANRLTELLPTFDVRLLMGGICHDIGKLYTKEIDMDGVAHYESHENYGAYLLLTNLCHTSNDSMVILDDVNEFKVAFYVNYHMLPQEWNTPRAIDKWRGIFGDENFDKLMLLNEVNQQED